MCTLSTNIVPICVPKVNVKAAIITADSSFSLFHNKKPILWSAEFLNGPSHKRSAIQLQIQPHN